MAQPAPRLGRALARFGVDITRWLAAGTGYVLYPLFAVVGAGSVVWYARNYARLKLLGTNALTFPQQLEALIPVGVAFGLMLLAFAALLITRRVRSGRLEFTRLVSDLGAWMLPLAAAPFVLALFQPDVEKTTPFLTLAYGGVAAAIVAKGIYGLGTSAPTTDLPESTSRLAGFARVLGRVAAPVALLAMVGAYGWFFSRLAIANHHALITRTIDLGIYDNIFYQTAHGRPLRCTFIKAEYHGSAHFDPILILLSPLYRLYPRAEFLLVLQSVWAGSAAIPVYLIARRFLESRLQGLAIAAAYLMHPALHGASLYEFHSLTLAPMPILWALYCLFSEKKVAYWFAFAAAVLVREDVPLMMIMVGTMAMLYPGGSLRRRGMATIFFSICYFGAVKAFFMTSRGVVMSGADSYSFGYYYQELIQSGRGLMSMLLSLLTNPAFVFGHAFEEPKVQFVITMFLPLLFLPFFARHRRLVLLYGMALTLLASRTAVFSTHFQYTSTILPFAFAILPEAIHQVASGGPARAAGLDSVRLKRALVLGVLVASACVSFKFGGIVENKTFRGGFSPVTRALNPAQQQTYAWIDQSARSLPLDKSVGVTNKLGPHVSNRAKVYFYGQRGTDFVFIDESELKKDRLDKHKVAVAEGRLVEVSRRGTYALFKANTEKPPSPADTGDDVGEVPGDDRPRE